MISHGKLAAIAVSAVSVAVVAPKVAPDVSLAGDSTRTYRVQQGDTLWGLAQRFYKGDPRAGVWELEHANHLASSDVVPGQTLVLP